MLHRQYLVQKLFLMTSIRSGDPDLHRGEKIDWDAIWFLVSDSLCHALARGHDAVGI